MLRYVRSFHIVSALVIISLFAGALFSITLPSQAQGGTSLQGTLAATPAGPDDSDELPILVNISGKVKAIAATSILIDDYSVVLPAGFVLPATVQIGAFIKLRANLRNDDTILLLFFDNGTPTPTATDDIQPEETEQPTEVATIEPTPTPSATQSSTLPATLIGTEQPTGVPFVILGCDKPRQKLGLLISSTYSVPYAEVVNWRCKGFTFGIIARAYLLVISGKEQNKILTLDDVFRLRLKGKHWTIIVIELGVHPLPGNLVISVTNGQVVIIVDCKYFKKHKDCKQDKPKKPKKPKK